MKNHYIAKSSYSADQSRTTHPAMPYDDTHPTTIARLAMLPAPSNRAPLLQDRLVHGNVSLHHNKLYNKAHSILRPPKWSRFLHLVLHTERCQPTSHPP
jgi:hypothetical protein